MLRDLLLEKSDAIVKRWTHLTLATYPADAGRFLRGEKDRFANPVGTIIAEVLEAVFGEMLAEMQPDRLRAMLDGVVRIRSVQEFSPSQAIGFIFLLKPVIREELGKGVEDGQLARELVEFESRIDRLALLAFDLFMQCREQIFEIRVKELRAGNEVALRMLAQGGGRERLRK